MLPPQPKMKQYTDTDRLNFLILRGDCIQSTQQDRQNAYFLMDVFQCLSGIDRDPQGKPYTDPRQLLDANLAAYETNIGEIKS